ncbi:hypothetical protein [Rhizobium sp. MHM7A]|uniref:hypothetical protein n=1 Tax=Rhizobium sp. MHM7A TaxID=2583233 RepID=UPI001105BFDE|nr:hypothetical protein [Rhizobium sp. MHM7A]TLX16859.1 hypothetical protein FFR93_05800 [Rhizobium sp. MHM7A]
MSTAYCAVLSELRDDVARDGLNPAKGGFYLLASCPDDVDADFDLWVIDLKDQSFQGEVVMLSEPIPAHDMQLAPSHSMGMAI